GRVARTRPGGVISGPVGLIPTPDHGDARRQAAAHVESQVSLCARDLAGVRLPGELLVGLEYLTHAGRADGMAVADQAAAGVHGDLPIDLAADVFAADLR